MQLHNANISATFFSGNKLCLEHPYTEVSDHVTKEVVID